LVSPFAVLKIIEDYIITLTSLLNLWTTVFFLEFVSRFRVNDKRLGFIVEYILNLLKIDRWCLLRFLTFLLTNNIIIANILTSINQSFSHANYHCLSCFYFLHLHYLYPILSMNRILTYIIITPTSSSSF
jgi:hypothetical protein